MVSPGRTRTNGAAETRFATYIITYILPARPAFSPFDAPAFSVSKPRGNNLVALGSAAVLIVYTAGFAKTKPAADRMAAESAERRPRSASRAGAGAVGVRTAAGESGDATVPATPAVAVVDGPAAALAPSTPSAVATPAGVATTPAPSNVTVTGSPATSATVAKAAAATTPVSAPVATVETAPPPVVNAPVTVAATPPVAAAPAAVPSAPSPVPTAPVPVSAPAPAAPPTAAPAAPPAAPAAKPAGKTTYKDGVYLGRGTSRHGDIEAMVEIQNGRITNAVISQCLTRYSCSWIAVLVPQVVARQSAEVDYVSGATVSSDAFYYAVTQALAQAK
jgi:uncharacterized protein with FMN-binding domain